MIKKIVSVSMTTNSLLLLNNVLSVKNWLPKQAHVKQTTSFKS